MSTLPKFKASENASVGEFLRIYSVQYAMPEEQGVVLGITVEQLSCKEFSRKLLCAIEYLSSMFKVVAPTPAVATETLVELAKTSIPLEDNQMSVFDYEAGHNLQFNPSRHRMQ